MVETERNWFHRSGSEPAPGIGPAAARFAAGGDGREFRPVVRQKSGRARVVAGETVLVNQFLVELYGIRGVTRSELREVRRPAGSVRCSLTQAAVLKVTPYGTATSPALRGV